MNFQGSRARKLENAFTSEDHAFNFYDADCPYDLAREIKMKTKQLLSELLKHKNNPFKGYFKYQVPYSALARATLLVSYSRNSVLEQNFSMTWQVFPEKIMQALH